MFLKSDGQTGPFQYAGVCWRMRGSGWIKPGKAKCFQTADSDLKKRTFVQNPAFAF
jgi:hypothetical protein